MKTRKFKLARLATLSLLVMPFSSVFAGTTGTITYITSPATAVPTLSGTMLIVLSLLLFAVAVRLAKQKNAAGKMFVTFLGVTAFSLGTGGFKLVSDAEAVGWTVIIPMPLNTGPTSGEAPISPGSNTFENNNPGTILTITGITPPSGGYICGNLVPLAGKDTQAMPAVNPICSVSLQIPSAGQCDLLCFSTANRPTE